MDNRGTPLHAGNVDATLGELRRQIRESERQLDKLRSTQVEVDLSPAAQTKVIQAAFEEVAESEPFLPFPESVLPALLALRRTHQTIVESREYLNKRASTASEEKRRLTADRATLKDSRLITEALNSRIESLKLELASKADLHPEDGARERLDEMRKKKKRYDQETSRLMKSLDQFINDHLAAMLAAEELGGPVVGDMMDLDSEDLAAGFNATGKLKKPKDGAANKDKRQRRLDEIWGSAEGGSQEDDEVSAAGHEMRQLMEGLLNALHDAKGNSSAMYVKLQRETASARFLVRSRVAQFHPKDATRLRMIDFGREIDE